MSVAIVGRSALFDALQAVLNHGVYTVHLYVNNVVPTVDTVLSHFVEASYPGYPVGGITPALPTQGSAGNEQRLTTVRVTFPPPSSGGPVMVFGWYVAYEPTFAAGPLAMLLGGAFPVSPTVLAVGGVVLPVIIDLSCLDANNP